MGGYKNEYVRKHDNIYLISDFPLPQQKYVYIKFKNKIIVTLAVKKNNGNSGTVHHKLLYGTLTDGLALKPKLRDG